MLFDGILATHWLNPPATWLILLLLTPLCKR